jgi:hypothetical protein
MPITEKQEAALNGMCPAAASSLLGTVIQALQNGAVSADVDDSTIEVNQSGDLAVKDAGITAAKLATTALATAARAILASQIVRANPAAADFATKTHMADYVDLDLSAIVPSGAKVVLLRVKIKDDTAGSSYAVRRKGDTKDTMTLWAQVANVWNGGFMICELDSSRVMQHKVVDAAGSPTAVTALSVGVVAWL